MSSIIESQLTKLLANVPASWLGTTFPNDVRFIGRNKFKDEMLKILSRKVAIDKTQLNNMFPEDYVRLGSPLSAVLEVKRAVEKGYHPHNVFSFGSNTLPLIAILLTVKKHVYVYGQNLTPSVTAQEARLRQLFSELKFTYCSGSPQPHPDGVVVLVADSDAHTKSPYVDAVVGANDDSGLLYIANTAKIATDDTVSALTGDRSEGVTTIRKRFGAPAPIPDVISLLTGEPLATAPDTAPLKQHLKEMAGCDEAKGDVLLGTTGLAALGACMMAAVVEGKKKVDLLMCSTAYGGSAQQADILIKHVPGFDKHTFDIQGAEGHLFKRLSGKVEAMKAGPRKALTFIQLEYPTNPDMKDANLSGLEALILDYQKVTGSKVIMLFDTTFSPISRVATGMFKNIAVIVFNSLSKSVSGGCTTGGSLVANHDAYAQKLLKLSHEYLALLDVGSKPCQLQILADRHAETEGRVAAAHKNAAISAGKLEECVKKYSGREMKVNFVTKEQIAKSVTPATFSFNMPAPGQATKDELTGLAQQFVDGLVEAYPKGIKPCVSFGQRNSLVYVTVPATSTQGVLSEADKAKQAVGGVQLVRFSFPPTMVLPAWDAAVDAAVKKLYALGSKL